MQGTALERHEAAPVPQISSLGTHPPWGDPWAEQRGVRGPPIVWRRQEGQIELSPVPGG